MIILTLNISAVLHGVVGITARNWEYWLDAGSPISSDDVRMIDDRIDDKVNTEKSEWQKRVMNSLKECIKKTVNIALL